jgi:hypothetical protein
MKCKRYIITFGFALFIVNCCQSQINKYGVFVPSKDKAKFDSLYPNASAITWYPRYENYPTQGVQFNCNCGVGTGNIVIRFDTLGNIQYKDIEISKKDLPDTIFNQLKNVECCDIATESVSSKGVIIYSIKSKLRPDKTSWVYTLKYNSAGEFISKEKIVYVRL